MNIKVWAAMKSFVVYKKKVLILREANKYQDGTNKGKYDIVGGRVKPGERFDKSLIREIKEETGIIAKIGRPFHVIEWRPVIKDEQWQIIATFFESISDTDKVTLSEDHDKYLWIDPKSYKKYNLIKNLYPAFESYLSK